MSVPMTLSDLKWRAWGVKFFSQVSIITLERFDLDQIWRGNTGGEKYISSGSATSPSKGARPKSPEFLAPPNNAKTVWPIERPNLVWWYTWGRNVFQGGQLHSILRGRDPSVPQIFGISYMRAHSTYEKQQRFRMVINYVRKIFTGSTTNVDARSVCGS